MVKLRESRDLDRVIKLGKALDRMFSEEDCAEERSKIRYDCHVDSSQTKLSKIIYIPMRAGGRAGLNKTAS